jgi:uncharacterized protein DUF3618
MSEKPEDSRQIADEIRVTRRELAETVSALVEKTDVRRQASKGIVRLRMRIHDSLAHVRMPSRRSVGRDKP